MPRGSGKWRDRGLAFCWVLLTMAARGSTPRWVTGPPYFTTAGQVVIWYTDTPQYFTDPGDLSASVNHAAADAMVAAAASVWNVPTARIVLTQGGILNESVSGANVYAGSGGLVFPADVQSTNYAAKQIAVIYDRDGSVTDLLLGAGASDPSGCRQNAVTESVDSITPAGFIEHVVLVLNGLCTGPAPEQQLQMQYQLERAFGRVLGLGWSQLNDNVFTETPQPTSPQMLHWPIMHPLDIICGLYTYQCLQQPFSLRDDDVASITGLYPVTVAGAGKVLPLTQAMAFDTVLQFPTGEGMAGVNVVLRRQMFPQQILDSFDDVSAVSGTLMQQQAGNPIGPQPAGIAASMGTPLWTGFNFAPIGAAGLIHLPWVPLPNGQQFQNMLVHTEPINPLYTGEYAVGPYQASTVEPSGSRMSWELDIASAGWYGQYYSSVSPVGDAASDCATGADGTESTPAIPDASGWWTGVLCGTNVNPWWYAHASWIALPIKANRGLTVEVTALDEQGSATTNKARPVIGIWSAEDALGSPADVAEATAFNGIATGLTTLTAQSSTSDTVRIAIAEEQGDGRPDYRYQARILYADTITPAVTSGGSHVTITGMGFRPGNVVTVGGVTAQVSSWTATTIVATVPYLKSVMPGTTVPVDVMVADSSTGGSTVMTGALQYVYTALPYTLALISAPSGSLPVGLPSTTSFVVKAIDIDGVTPLAGVSVVFSTTSGSVVWSGCGGSTCTVTTGANGQASIGVTPSSPGVVTLQAAALGLTQTASFQGVALIRLVTVTPAATYLAAGATASWSASASALQQGLPALLTPISWAVSGVGMILSELQTITDLSGAADVTVMAGPLAGGAQATGSACVWALICGSFVVQGVDPSQFVVSVTAGAGQSVAATAALLPMAFSVSDGAGDSVVGATVTIHQTVSQWTATCPEQGRCPVAPIYQAVNITAISDANGMVTVMPLQIAGPEVTDVVVTSGTQGFVSLTMQKHP